MTGKPHDPSLPIDGYRLFRLFHLMVLVAGIAITLVAGPVLMRGIMRAEGDMSYWNQRSYLEGVVILSLSLWSLALTPLMLLMNHSRLAEASRSFGTAAVFASGMAVAFMLLAKAIETLLWWGTVGLPRGWFSPSPFLVLAATYREIPKVASASILAAWSTLGLSRAGRKPSEMNEWLGFIFGLCWIVWTLCVTLLALCQNSWLEGPGPELR